jgi:hypothetical protein
MNRWSRNFFRLVAFTATLASTHVHAAAPKLALGSAGYTGQEFVTVPVTLSDNTAATAAQFDVQFATGGVDIVAALGGAVLGDSNIYWSAVTGPTNMTTYRVVISPAAGNPVLQNGNVVSILLRVVDAQKAQGTVVSIANVALAGTAANGVMANECGALALIYDPANATADTDKDGLADLAEINTHKTSPASNDTDCDGMPDGYEVARAGLNPLVDDALGDLDNDGRTNYAEYVAGTNPAVADGTLLAAGTLPATISANSYLTAGATYQVSGKVSVATGATFSIPRGTRLQFQTGAALSVNGRLFVSGTASQPVVLTSIGAAPQRGDWAGIVMNAGSSGSAIQYANVQWATTAIRVVGAEVTVRDSTITNFKTYGLRMENGAGGWVEKNVFDNTNKTATAISLLNVSPSIKGYDLFVRRNDIKRAAVGIAFLGNTNPWIDDANQIRDNATGLLALGGQTYGANPAPYVVTNSITGNTTSVKVDQFLSPATTIFDARFNIWGGVDNAMISASITDRRDGGANAPYVEFIPMLDPSNLVTAGTNAIDTDHDGLTDAEEYVLGTAFYLADSDADSIPDGYEVANALDPLNDADGRADTDGDGLTNAQEFSIGTNINWGDSDGDSISDGYEVANGLNPKSDDRYSDLDGDSLSNLTEYLIGTKANSSDTDGDGLSDGYEYNMAGFNPLNSSDGVADYDGDGLSNAMEVWFGTNMRNPDSNGNGKNDLVEYREYVTKAMVPIINFLLE